MSRQTSHTLQLARKRLPRKKPKERDPVAAGARDAP